MKKTLLFVAFLLVCALGFGQSERPYFIRYRTANDTVYLNTHSVNGIHIDALGHELTHEDGTAWSALTDLDTVYIYRVEEEHNWVDLGLPSGLLWASCNVGANNPEDYGDYFAWAETRPKSNFVWDNYIYTCGGNFDMTKYCTDSVYGCNGYTDNLTILQAGDDAATANWGSGWRTPTIEEWNELRNHCTSMWTTQNGVNGRRFTGPNGNSIFLPAAGYRADDNLYLGSGRYWSGSLHTDYPYSVWYFYFNSDSPTMFGDFRCMGHSVRAVRSARQK